VLNVKYGGRGGGAIKVAHYASSSAEQQNCPIIVVGKNLNFLGIRQSVIIHWDKQLSWDIFPSPSIKFAFAALTFGVSASD
jgi:hypothetical protein